MAEFMEAALYDPSGGFFERSTIGERGDFLTSPHVSPAFGPLVARQVEVFWGLLGSPTDFGVVEVGAGDGTLARQVLEALPASLVSAHPYQAVERSHAGRAAAERLLSDLRAVVVESIEELERSESGSVVANELFDNVPMHLVRATPRGLVELRVEVNGERFEFGEAEPASGAVARLAPDLNLGEEAAVAPEALTLLDGMCRHLGRGYVWMADYGWTGEDPASRIHAYRGHREEPAVLEAPGSRDITAGVDFDALAAHARGRGHRVWGPVTQRAALLSLGFRELDARAQARQVDAVAARRGVEALTIYSNRTRANLLLGQGGLGDFLVLCVGVGDVPDDAPISVSG